MPAIILTLFLCTVSFVSGAWYENNSWQQKWSDFQIHAYEQTMELNQKLKQQEYEASQKVRLLQQVYQDEITDLSTRHNHELSRLKLLLKQSADTSKSDPVSSTSNTTAGTAATGTCGCSTQDRQISRQRTALQHISEELLRLARDKDQLALRYNALLKIYQEQSDEGKEYVYRNTQSLPYRNR